MKKYFALFLCAFLICATPIIAYAEGESTEPVETDTTVSENLPTEEEVATESEISADTETLPDQIVGFIKENFEGTSFISLAVTVVVYIFYEVKKHKSLNGSIGVMNNNAVAVAENSAKAIGEVMAKADTIVDDVLAKANTIADNSSIIVQKVLAEVASIAEEVKGYRDELTSALAEIRKNAEEKQSLEDTLLSVQKTMETLKMADLEFGNEVAELLVLANIPNAKKEELYSRHRAAVDAIATVENTEVVTNDGIEA